MTAEERLAYFQGEKRRTEAHQKMKKEENIDVILFKMKFFIALILFIVFLSMDYTGYKIKGIGSVDVMEEVIKDFEIPISKNTL